jgi:energy-converting hydrogenase B subunit D
MSILVYVLLVLTALAGTAVVLARDPRRQVLAMSANGLVLALLFMVLQAPDVAFSELAIGMGAVPLLFVAVLASTRMDRRPRPADEKPSEHPPETPDMTVSG